LRHELRGGFLRPAWRVPRSGSRRSARHRPRPGDGNGWRTDTRGDPSPHRGSPATLSALPGDPEREMNSDDVAATRRRHRFQAAVYSAV